MAQSDLISRRIRHYLRLSSYHPTGCKDLCRRFADRQSSLGLHSIATSLRPFPICVVTATCNSYSLNRIRCAENCRRTCGSSSRSSPLSSCRIRRGAHTQRARTIEAPRNINTHAVLRDLCFASGSIPHRHHASGTMHRFLASGCAWSGRLPLNINAATIDLSHANFTGQLILFDERFTDTPVVTSLALANAGRLSCPIQISSLIRLQSLDISSNGFSGCDFTNVTLPAALAQLDISDNEWQPFELAVPPAVVRLQASRASITAVPIHRIFASLQELILDGNPINPAGSSGGDSVDDQVRILLAGGYAPCSDPSAVAVVVSLYPSPR